MTDELSATSTKKSKIQETIERRVAEKIGPASKRSLAERQALGEQSAERSERWRVNLAAKPS